MSESVGGSADGRVWGRSGARSSPRELIAEEPGSLEGWVPVIGPDCPLERVIDRAFDYRGNTTVVKTDGTRITGYVFNRNADVADPFIEIFDAAGAGPFRIGYGEIRTIEFTGKDTAAGQSYAAWLARKGREAAGSDGDRPRP